MKKISKDWFDFYEVATTIGEPRNDSKTVLYASSFNIKVYYTSKYFISTFTVLLSNIFFIKIIWFEPPLKINIIHSKSLRKIPILHFVIKESCISILF